MEQADVDMVGTHPGLEFGAGAGASNPKPLSPKPQTLKGLGFRVWESRVDKDWRFRDLGFGSLRFRFEFRVEGLRVPYMA